MLPDHPLVPIPPDDEIYTRKVGYDLSDVQNTKAAGETVGYPELEGVKLDGHWAIIYSKYDIGCALETPRGRLQGIHPRERRPDRGEHRSLFDAAVRAASLDGFVRRPSWRRVSDATLTCRRAKKPSLRRFPSADTCWPGC